MMNRVGGLGFASALVVAMIGAASPLSASAAGVDDSTTVTAPMSIDCSQLTAAGISYLRKNHISACGVDSTGPTTNASGTASGTCGVTRITINDLGGSKAHIQWGATSKIGLITERSVTPIWYNETKDTQGSTLDLFPMASATYTSNWWSPTTGKGKVHATLTGEIIINAVIVCNVYDPTAVTTIT